MIIVERNQETPKGHYPPIMERVPLLKLLSSIQYSGSPFVFSSEKILFNPKEIKRHFFFFTLSLSLLYPFFFLLQKKIKYILSFFVKKKEGTSFFVTKKE